jgi:hypothetical protein
VEGCLGAEHFGMQSGRDILPALGLADETATLTLILLMWRLG